MSNNEEILQRAWDKVSNIHETRAALAERKLLNAMDPEVHAWERAQFAPAPEMVRRTNEDGLVEQAPAQDKSLQEILGSVVELIGEETGRMFAELSARIKKLEEKISD